MDRDTRNAIERATQRARKLLEDDFASQLEGTFDVLRVGSVAPKGGPHLSLRQSLERDKVVSAIEHKKARGMSSAEGVADYLRDASFTAINRFVALKMLEARGLVQECISKGELSAGYREFCGLAPGVALLPESTGYRLYIESLFDELSTEVKVLFDRRESASVLWPRRATIEALLDVLNAADLVGVWGEDETIGWVYQYFNSSEERREMRESQAPRTSRELAIRNQFFTPRYVVDFLVHNTLGALWVEMTSGRSALGALSLRLPRAIGDARPRKDPRDIRVLDPACGSGHFLLCAFDLMVPIYREAWALADGPRCVLTGRTLREDFPSVEELERQIPKLILRHSLFGIDIDPRCAQIAALALWMRAQREWNTQKLPRATRPSIDRTNVVIAEPIPTGKDTRDAFVRELDPKLARLAEALFNRLDLAGEAGSLLEIGDWFQSEIRDVLGEFGPLFSQSDGERWRAAETSLVAKLRTFAVEASARREWQKTLFVDDAARGLAFIDVTRESFDVVLMNPPFGDSTTRARSACGPELSLASSDIGGAFVLAAKRRWAPEGCIGVLSSTALWFKPTVAEWRRQALLTDGYAVRAAAHLGGGVLDGATVSASATVIDRMAKGENAVFVRLLFEDDKTPRLFEAVSSLHACRRDEHVFQVVPDDFSQFRGAPLAYWISKGLRSKLASFPALESRGADVRQGVETPDDFRFVAAWWEVPLEDIGLGKNWVPFAKSSEYSPLWDDITWVVRWADGGREVWAFERSHPAPAARHARGAPSTSYFGRAGITYPARSVLGFNPRAFPKDAGFGHMGAVAFPIEVDAHALLGYLASRPLEYVLSFSNGALQGKKGAYPNHYEVGQIKGLPWPTWTQESLSIMRRNGDALATAAMELQTEDETTHQYAGRPGLHSLCSVRAVAENSIQRRAALMLQVRNARAELDAVVAAELGFDADDIAEMDREFSRCESPTTGPWSPNFGVMSDTVLREEAEHLASELVGFAIGRFDIRPALRGGGLRERRSAFDALPPGPPAILGEVPADYPVPLPADGLLLVDSGNSHDLGFAVSRIASVLWGDRSARMEEELATCLGFEDLASYYSATSQRGFFGRHLTQYAKSRRSAPVYWSLGTSSGQYSVLLHYPKLRRDTLFAILHDHVEPKLSHETRSLETLQRGFGSAVTSGQRKAVATKQALVDELRAFIEELKRVAPLWDPNLNDGVAINSAPLWRLATHQKPWQKDLKATWEAICVGEYDWARLAMHLWPERVVPKCACDRSIAIAHGLESEFWIEGTDAKWKPRTTPVKSMAELVRERTSPAVKAALKNLLDAPTASGSGRGRGRRAGSPAAGSEGGTA